MAQKGNRKKQNQLLPKPVVHVTNGTYIEG